MGELIYADLETALLSYFKIIFTRSSDFLLNQLVVSTKWTFEDEKGLDI